jgi:hypothetical protein
MVASFHSPQSCRVTVGSSISAVAQNYVYITYWLDASRFEICNQHYKSSKMLTLVELGEHVG